MPLTSKSKARNKKVHMEIEPATAFQALPQTHEACDLLVPSKASPISLPTPSCFYMNSTDSSATKGKRKGSLCTRHVATFSPYFEILFRNPMQLKCLYLPFFFFFFLMPSQIRKFSLFSFQGERNKAVP